MHGFPRLPDTKGGDESLQTCARECMRILNGPVEIAGNSVSSRFRHTLQCMLDVPHGYCVPSGTEEALADYGFPEFKFGVE